MSNIIEQELVKMHYDTFGDIVREMRGQGGDSGYPLDIRRYADRIDAMASATARQIEEMAAENARLTDMYDNLNESYGELYMDKIRLLDALKPVLECSVIDIKDYSEMVDAFFTVRKAQEIYNKEVR